MSHKFRVIDWNLRGIARHSGQGKFLADRSPDLCTLQEVTEQNYQHLKDAMPEAWSVFSLHLRVPSTDEGRVRKLGCAIFGFQQFELKRSFLLDVPFPERTLAAEISTPFGSCTVCSIHIPPGASHEKLKPETYVRLADWFGKTRGPILFGIDANAPKSDRRNHDDTEWWWHDEPLLLGPKPKHHLSDLYRVFLGTEGQPDKSDLRHQVDDPLAVTYKRGTKKDGRIPCRYDYLYGTDHFKPYGFDHPYDDSIKAGSDHSAVIADLEYSDPGPRIYIASKVRHVGRWRELADTNVSASWIKTGRISDERLLPVLWETCVREISSSDLLVVYCEEEETLKGCLVEIGVALNAGIPIYCIGKCSSVIPDEISDASFTSHRLWNGADSVEDAISKYSEFERFEIRGRIRHR